MTTWFVPGRVEVLGKHTDYAGGRSLLAAVNRGISVEASGGGVGITATSDAGLSRTRADLMGHRTVMWFFPAAGTFG